MPTSVSISLENWAFHSQRSQLLLDALVAVRYMSTEPSSDKQGAYCVQGDEKGWG